MEDVLSKVSALLRKLELDSHRECDTLVGCPEPGLVLVCGLLCNSVEACEVAHVDGKGDIAGRLSSLVLTNYDRWAACIHIGVCRYDRKHKLLVQEPDSDHISPVIAKLVDEGCCLRCAVEVAVLGREDVRLKVRDLK